MRYKSTTYEKVIFICQWNVENIHRINSKQNQTFFFQFMMISLSITMRSEYCCKIYDYKWIEYCSRLLYQPVFDTNVTTSMWHYVICVNHVIVYRNIRLNYFNIIEPSNYFFPFINKKKFWWEKIIYKFK